MSATLQEFDEILNAEDGHVDLVKLQEFAAHGIPQKIRGEVWLHLLNVRASHTSQTAEQKRAFKKHYASLDTFVEESVTRGKIEIEAENLSKNQPKLHNPRVRRAMRNTLGAYLNHHGAVFKPYMLHVLGPLAIAVEEEADLYHAFRALMNRLETLRPVEERCSDFLALFCFLLGNLSDHLEDQELDPITWVPRLLQGMGTQELPMESVLRLWDYYLSIPNGFKLHPFICLALLDKFKEDLLELENIDNNFAFGLFESMSPIDTANIIVNANNTKRTSSHLLYINHIQQPK